MASPKKYRLKKWLVVVNDTTGEVGASLDMTGFSDRKRDRLWDSMLTRIDLKNWHLQAVRRRKRPAPRHSLYTGRRVGE